MIAAVILAGGRGERLGGVIKSELRIGNVRLLDRVGARLTGCTPILVASGGTDPALLHLPPNFIPVADLLYDYAGPIAGFAAAVSQLDRLAVPPDYLVSVAVDTPFLPADFLDRLVEALGSGGAALAAYAGQTYPTNSIWRLAAVRALPRQLADGTAPHNLKRLAAGLGAAECDWAGASPEDPFANLNTPEDRALLEQRATAEKLEAR